MQHLQTPDNMSDIMTTFNFMNQIQQHFIDQSELIYEPIVIYPDLPLVFSNTNKFDEMVSLNKIIIYKILISDFVSSRIRITLPLLLMQLIWLNNKN